MRGVWVDAREAEWASVGAGLTALFVCLNKNNGNNICLVGAGFDSSPLRRPRLASVGRGRVGAHHLDDDNNDNNDKNDNNDNNNNNNNNDNDKK